MHLELHSFKRRLSKNIKIISMQKKVHCILNFQAASALRVTQLNMLRFILFKMIKAKHQGVKKISKSFGFHVFKSSLFHSDVTI